MTFSAFARTNQHLNTCIVCVTKPHVIFTSAVTSGRSVSEILSEEKQSTALLQQKFAFNSP